MGEKTEGQKKGRRLTAAHSAEEEGFEPSRLLQPTGVRSQTLQPLGYSSQCRSPILNDNPPFRKDKNRCRRRSGEAVPRRKRPGRPPGGKEFDHG